MKMVRLCEDLFAEEIVEGMGTERREARTSVEVLKGNVWSGAALVYGKYVVHAWNRYSHLLRRNVSVSSVYEFDGDDRDCDSVITIRWIDTVAHEDDGHAIAAAIKWCDERRN